MYNFLDIRPSVSTRSSVASISPANSRSGSSLSRRPPSRTSTPTKPLKSTSPLSRKLSSTSSFGVDRLKTPSQSRRSSNLSVASAEEGKRPSKPNVLEQIKQEQEIFKLSESSVSNMKVPSVVIDNEQMEKGQVDSESDEEPDRKAPDQLKLEVKSSNLQNAVQKNSINKTCLNNVPAVTEGKI